MDEIGRPSAEPVGGRGREPVSPKSIYAPMMGALVSEPPSASPISAMTPFPTCSPAMSSGAVSNRGKSGSERVFGHMPVGVWRDLGIDGSGKGR